MGVPCVQPPSHPLREPSPTLSPTVPWPCCAARRVFDQLVDASCQDGTPQCFLITPKLLPRLHYRPEVEVLTIVKHHRPGPQPDHELARTAEVAHSKVGGDWGGGSVVG